MTSQTSRARAKELVQKLIFEKGNSWTNNIDNIVDLMVSFHEKEINKQIPEMVSFHEKEINKQIPEIWGDGWYAIYDDDERRWDLAPIEYFKKHGACPDGWDWDKPSHMSDEEFEEFVELNGCVPNIPKDFYYCMESSIRSTKLTTKDEEHTILKEFGFTVDDVPLWWYDRT